jgi:hypothetical protein
MALIIRSAFRNKIPAKAGNSKKSKHDAIDISRTSMSTKQK